jgi:hypothetical protein
VLGSRDYLRAIEKDLLAAADRLDDLARLVVVSSREMEGRRLDRHLVTGDASVQLRLGGARVSLHARVARRLLELAAESGWDVGRLRPMYQQMLTTVAEAHVNHRRRMTDEEVRQFISQELAKDSRATATGLLRRLRESGRACEQDRFKRLVTEARKRAHGA